MPLVKRSLTDFFSLSPHTDVLVNPVNTIGVMGAGLASVFRERYPSMYEEYRLLCKEGKLEIGKLHIYHDADSKNIIVNLPTKKHFKDPSEIPWVEVGLEKLALYLKQHPFYTVVTPVLGIGYGLLDINAVYPIMVEHLDRLPNIIHVSLRPDRLDKIPQYLVVAGSREYTDSERIGYGVQDGLLAFGASTKDFEAMVSGGARGVDRIACGKGIDDPAPNLAKALGMRGIVCQADWDRYGNTAGFLRNRVVEDIGTHFVLFIGSRSHGTKSLLAMIERHNEHADKLMAARLFPQEDDLFPSKLKPRIPEKKQVYIVDISKISQ